MPARSKEEPAQDVLFHQWLARVAGVSGVWRAIQSAKAHLDRVHRLAVPVGGRMSGVCIEHAADPRRDGRRRS